jgi:hypothetical protein
MYFTDSFPIYFNPLKYKLDLYSKIARIFLIYSNGGDNFLFALTCPFSSITGKCRKEKFYALPSTGDQPNQNEFHFKKSGQRRHPIEP